MTDQADPTIAEPTAGGSYRANPLTGAITTNPEDRAKGLNPAPVTAPVEPGADAPGAEVPAKKSKSIPPAEEQV